MNTHKHIGAEFRSPPTPLVQRCRSIPVPGQPDRHLTGCEFLAHPLGDIEVWYSGNGEVIRTQNGRIVATSGLPIDWRAVRFASSPPSWSAVPAEGAFYQRSRDEMPLHRYAITERLKLARLADQPSAVSMAPLPLAQARAATWFREDTLSSTAEPVPSALFAWGNYAGQGAVVYSYQCLSATFCLKLMPWPVQEVAP